jgi:sugar phosphate isomerase/epimerase
VSDWPIGLSTGCYFKRSIFDVLATIREAGFAMVEVVSSHTHLDYHDTEMVAAAAREMERLGMEPYSFHAPFADQIDISSLDAEQRRFSVEEINKAAEAAAILRVRYFVIHAGPEREMHLTPDEHSKRIANTARSLDVVAGRCERLGIGLALENKLPHLLFGKTCDMLWIMGAMETLRVSTCLDTSHALLSGDIYRVMYKLSGHLRLIHANDSRGQRDDHLAPGDGITDWTRLIDELNDIGFHGGIIMEIAGDGGMGPDASFLQAARRGRALLRELLRTLDLSTPPTAILGRRS